MGIGTQVALSHPSELAPLYQTVIFHLEGKEGCVPVPSTTHSASKCIFPVIDWTCTSALLRNSRPDMGVKPYFRVLFFSFPYPVKALHPFQEERSLGKEGGFFSSRVTKSTFSLLLCLCQYSRLGFGKALNSLWLHGLLPPHNSFPWIGPREHETQQVS